MGETALSCAWTDNKEQFIQFHFIHSFWLTVQRTLIVISIVYSTQVTDLSNHFKKTYSCGTITSNYVDNSSYTQTGGFNKAMHMQRFFKKFSVPLFSKLPATIVTKYQHNISDPWTTLADFCCCGRSPIIACFTDNNMHVAKEAPWNSLWSEK